MVFGLTGGVASGKSLVSNILRGLGAHIIDADLLAREVVEPGKPAYDEIVREFGGEILSPGGAIDRKRLGDIVFKDEERRRRLNAITHPRIRARIKEEVERIESSFKDPVIILDVALLIEGGLYSHMDGVIVVYADPGKQFTRLKARNGLSEEEARSRIASQMPLKEKLEYADYVINNNGSIGETEAQVRDLFHKLTGRIASSKEA